MVKLCPVGMRGAAGEPQWLCTVRKNKLRREPRTHWVVARLTKAVQNALKSINTLKQWR